MYQYYYLPFSLLFKFSFAVFNEPTFQNFRYMSNFIRILKTSYPNESISNTLATLIAALQYPDVLKSGFNLKVDDLVAGILYIYDDLLSVWTKRAILHPYSIKVHKMIRHIRLELKNIRDNHSDVLQVIREFQLQRQTRKRRPR